MEPCNFLAELLDIARGNDSRKLRAALNIGVERHPTLAVVPREWSATHALNFGKEIRPS